MRRTDLAAVGLVLFWSSGFIGARLASDTGHWFSALTWRFLIAATILVAICLARGVRISRGALREQVAIGLLSQAVYLGLLFRSVDLGVSSGTAALIAALQPLVVASVAGPLIGEHTTGRQRLGLVLGLAGVALVVSDELDAGAAWWVYLLPIAAMLSLATGTIGTRRARVEIPALGAVTVHITVTAVVYLAIAVLQGDAAPRAELDFWAAVAWMVVLATFCGYGFYQYVVRTRGATTASTLLYLTPPTTMLVAWAMFGDRVGLWGLTGLLVCAAGVWLAIATPTAGHPPDDLDQSPRRL